LPAAKSFVRTLKSKLAPAGFVGAATTGVSSTLSAVRDPTSDWTPPNGPLRFGSVTLERNGLSTPLLLSEVFAALPVAVIGSVRKIRPVTPAAIGCRKR